MIAETRPEVTADPNRCDTSAAERNTNILILADILERCASFAADIAKAPPIPSPPSFKSRTFVFYVFSVAGDATSSPLVIARVVNRLNYSISHPDVNATRVSIVGRPDWTTFAAFQAQCTGDNLHTVGALVIDGLTPMVGTENFLVWTYGWTRLTAAADIVTCPQSTNTSPAVPQIAWSESGLEGGGYRNGFPFVTVGAVSSILGKNVNQTTTTTTEGTPAPHPSASPNPASAASTSTTTTTTNNPTPAILLGALGTALQGQTAPAINASSELNAAAYHLADDIMSRLNARCKTSPNKAIAEVCNELGGFQPTPAATMARWFSKQ